MPVFAGLPVTAFECTWRTATDNTTLLATTCGEDGYLYQYVNRVANTVISFVGSTAHAY
jgi:hypothetical protein